MPNVQTVENKPAQAMLVRLGSVIAHLPDVLSWSGRMQGPTSTLPAPT